MSNQRHFTEDHISNLEVDSFLFATIQVELHDERAMSLQNQGAGITDFEASAWVLYAALPCCLMVMPGPGSPQRRRCPCMK